MSPFVVAAWLSGSGRGRGMFRLLRLSCSAEVPLRCFGQLCFIPWWLVVCPRGPVRDPGPWARVLARILSGGPGNAALFSRFRIYGVADCGVVGCAERTLPDRAILPTDCSRSFGCVYLVTASHTLFGATIL